MEKRGKVTVSKKVGRTEMHAPLHTFLPSGGVVAKSQDPDIDDVVDLFLPTKTQEDAQDALAGLKKTLRDGPQFSEYSFSKDTPNELVLTNKSEKTPALTVKQSSRDDGGTTTHGLDITISNPEKHPELLQLVRDFVPDGHIVIVDQCGGKDAGEALINQFKGAIKFSEGALADKEMAALKSKYQKTYPNMFPEGPKPSDGPKRAKL